VFLINTTITAASMTGNALIVVVEVLVTVMTLGGDQLVNPSTPVCR